MINPYEELANAVVLQAVKDYRQAISTNHQPVQAGIEKFFRSAWFGALTTLDAEFLIDGLKEETAR